ncbi:hypothetical protein H5J24_24100 [Chryseobacterium capnotolerans]|uniref:hypothetical protein n=1 Tax=Chryseobacterium TaxID=59732 RepID=UPI00083B06C1|nr:MULTISPECIES: hypothetical protein [Chryseobacterium]UHO38541.1 hypothetical protein H5J24_24100 [Chryseobacterium capnotolerans]
MKKIFFLLSICLFILQSCNVSSEIVYHKDATSTSVTDIDMRRFLAEVRAATPDSLKDKDEYSDLNKYPAAWTNLQELEQKSREVKDTNPDHIRIMNKIFMKTNRENEAPTGVSLKTEHFNQDDYTILSNYLKAEKLPVEQNIFNPWDGKVLTINTENFNLKNIQASITSSRTKDDPQKIEGMMMMYFKNIGTTLKFENKIKSITGKHDWLKQIDDYTLKITYDLKALYEQETTFKNSDQKIIIVTE